MDPNDFKDTIKNILDLDIDDKWDVESDEECSLSCYGGEDVPNDYVTVYVEQRKSSTGSQVSQVSNDSLNQAEAFQPVEIDMTTVKTALNMYQKHNRKISMSKVVGVSGAKTLEEAAEIPEEK